MKNKIKFIAISLWILFSRIYDAYCTYQFTPTLEREANPLVTILGFSWGPLLLVVGGGSLYIIYAFYISSSRDFDLFPKESNYRFSEFSTYLYLGKRKHWLATFYQLPNNLERFHHYMGNVASSALAFLGVVSTIMWLLLKYSDFYPPYHSATMIYTILILGVLMIIYGWSYSQYRRYQRLYS